MQCENCGKDTSEGLGTYTNQGFLCNVCLDSLGYLLCIKCGKKYRRDDMIEWDDKFYCRNCVKIKKPIVRLRPIAKFGGGSSKAPKQQPQKRATIKDLEPGLFKNLNQAIHRGEDAEIADKFNDLEGEIKGEAQEIDMKDKDVDSLEELKQLGDKLREAREKKKKQDDDDYSVKND